MTDTVLPELVRRALLPTTLPVKRRQARTLLGASPYRSTLAEALRAEMAHPLVEPLRHPLGRLLGSVGDKGTLATLSAGLSTAPSTPAEHTYAAIAKVAMAASSGGLPPRHSDMSA
ncbi:hypothetical protein [Modestobacter sp. I12A-02662]|uniref:hypothetical protein n=1 Tax=Modestobacter sp. I12A-02662 TaxID=1730496 RepID=UPI0034DFDD60